MFTLREDQAHILDQARFHMRNGKKRILIQSPTGSGKTVMSGEMIKTATEKNLQVNFMVHRRELVKQAMKTFSKFDLPYGVVSSNFAQDITQPTQICSVQTLIRRMDKVRRPDMIIWDEAHHCAASSWHNIFTAYKDSFHILMTATPERLDGKGLHDYADVIVNGPSVQWLIANGHLCDYKAYEPNQVDMTGVKKSMGDFSRSGSAEKVNKATITGSAINEYEKLLHGKRAVVFAITIEHSKDVVQQFNSVGIPAKHVDGKTPETERDLAIEEFESGKIKILSNVGLFGEGFDLPCLEGVIMLRPTQSLGFYLQMCGRSLRPSPGKTHATLIDHVGNITRHGLPCDERIWTLDGREKKKRGGDNGAPVRICTACFGAQPPRSDVCCYCGVPFPIQEREIEEITGDLVEVEKEKKRQAQKEKRMEAGKAQTLEQLIELGKARGYKNPGAWASHVFNGRRR